jgi:hypothetical protein
MPDASHLFADRLVNIAVTGPLVRIELGAMQLPTAEGQKPQLVPTQTLVMPLDGFVASFGMMESVVRRLISDGVLKQNEAPAHGLGNSAVSVTQK